MPFPWAAVAAAGAGLIGGVVQGNQQRSAADAANKTQENKFKRSTSVIKKSGS